MDQKATLRSLKGAIIVVDCKACGIHGELDRKEVVRRFRASAPLSRVRRGVVGHCAKMCADGVDRCDARLRSRHGPAIDPSPSSISTDSQSPGQ